MSIDPRRPHSGDTDIGRRVAARLAHRVDLAIEAQAQPTCPMCGAPSKEMPEELGGGAYLCDACAEEKGRDPNEGRPREGRRAQRGRMVVNGQPYQADTRVWIDGAPYTIDTVEGDAVILLDESGNPTIMPLAKVVEGLKLGAPDRDAGRRAQDISVVGEIVPCPDCGGTGEQGDQGYDDSGACVTCNGRGSRHEFLGESNGVKIRTLAELLEAGRSGHVTYYMLKRDPRPHAGKVAQSYFETGRRPKTGDAVWFLAGSMSPFTPKQGTVQKVEQTYYGNHFYADVVADGKTHRVSSDSMFDHEPSETAVSDEYGTTKKWAQSWAHPSADAHVVVWFYHPGDPKPVSEITAEVVKSPRGRRVGLQGRERLHPAAGMVFLHPDGPAERQETFHMGAVKFPIDIVWIGRDRRIKMIAANRQPGAKGQWGNLASAVIEVCGGYCKAHAIEVGDEVGFGRVVRAGRRTAEAPDPGWGERWGTWEGPGGERVYMFRKGQKCRFYNGQGEQVGPEQSNVAPAHAWAMSNGYRFLGGYEASRRAQAEQGTLPSMGVPLDGTEVVYVGRPYGGTPGSPIRPGVKGKVIEGGGTDQGTIAWATSEGEFQRYCRPSDFESGLIKTAQATDLLAGLVGQALDLVRSYGFKDRELQQMFLKAPAAAQRAFEDGLRESNDPLQSMDGHLAFASYIKMLDEGAKQGRRHAHRQAQQAGRCNCENSSCQHQAGGCKTPAGAHKVQYVGAVCDACFEQMPAEYRLGFRALVCPACGTNRSINPTKFAERGDTIRCIGCGYEGPWSGFDQGLPKEAQATGTCSECGYQGAEDEFFPGRDEPPGIAEIDPRKTVRCPQCRAIGMHIDFSGEDDRQAQALTIKEVPSAAPVESQPKTPKSKVPGQTPAKDMSKAGQEDEPLLNDADIAVLEAAGITDARGTCDHGFDMRYPECSYCNGPAGKLLGRDLDEEAGYSPAKFEQEGQAQSYDLLRTISEACVRRGFGG